MTESQRDDLRLEELATKARQAVRDMQLFLTNTLRPVETSKPEPGCMPMSTNPLDRIALDLHEILDICQELQDFISKELAEKL